MYKVVFLPEGKSAETEAGVSVLAAAEKAGVLLDASCNGKGSCGKCKVKLGGREALACQTKVDRDMEITVPGVHGGSGRKKKMLHLPEDFQKDIRITKTACKVRRAKMDYQRSDCDRIRDALALPSLRFRPGLLATLHQALEAEKGNVTLTVKCSADGAELIAIEKGDTSESCYAAAFDIGTTTVVGMLWSLTTGELRDVEARTNYQSLYGADVISRIQYSMEGEGHLQTLQSKLMQCCNDILSELCERSGIRQEHIYDAVMVGNTTMSHLAFGVTPVSLARTPFAPVFREAQEKRAGELGLSIYPLANVHLLPNIAGHVGSDIVGMMLAAGMDRLRGAHIAIDIGTNGEVVAVKDGRLLCCSTAAGPAFEGATIRHGMRAAPGAIEGITMDENGVYCKTIDDAAAIGICGSGLIDAVSELLRVGIVERSGRMLSRAQALAAGVPALLAGRITGEGTDACFVLEAGAEPIVLTQGDIREVQLAKGAILAGIQTLMEALSIDTEELDSILLAGAFGNYINIKSALAIGLLPPLAEEKVVAIGNAAGVGACMALLSDAERRRAEQLALTTVHLELAANPSFQEHYAEAMWF